MVNSTTLPLPTGGINISDSHLAISDTQARRMDNLIINTTSMESIRPNEGYEAKVTRVGSWSVTDDIYVYRKKDGTIQYMFGYNGQVHYSTSKYGVLMTIDHSWTTGYRLFFCQFQDNLYIFNGHDTNMVWDGTNLRQMGITPPANAPTLSSITPAGTDVRYYYYTYYNSADDIESNPSPSVSTVVATPGRDGGSVSVTVEASTDTQVDKIRIYRTGFGIVTPKLAMEIDNITGTYIDVSIEENVVLDDDLETDHDTPQPFKYAIVQNNRMMCWGVPGADDELWISNEFEGEYYPILPFYEQQIIKSGGPVVVNPGDGSGIVSVVPWGGAVIVLKHNAAYRVQETEIGFYGYQSISIPGCIAERSAILTTFGLVYLTDSGFILLDSDEALTRIGDLVSNWTCNITDFSSVASIAYRGLYITSFKVGSNWYSMTFNPEKGWQGNNTATVGSCYFNDINILMAGSVNEDFAYIEECQLDKYGSITTRDIHPALNIKYQDKGREYYENFYSRIREVRITGETIGRVSDQNLTLNIYDGEDKLLDTNTFVFPANGTVCVGIASEAMARYISFEIVGTITRPIRISGIRPTVEQIGYGWGE